MPILSGSTLPAAPDGYDPNWAQKQAVAPKTDPFSPTTSQVIGATLAEESWIVSGMIDQSIKGAYGQSDPFKDEKEKLDFIMSTIDDSFKDDKNFMEQVAQLNTPTEIEELQERRRIKAKTDEILSAATTGQAIAGIGALMATLPIDPLTWVGGVIGAAAKGAKWAKPLITGGMGRRVGAGALTAAGYATADELLLHNFNPFRSYGESISNIVGAGVLGAGIGALVGKSVNKALKDDVQSIKDQVYNDLKEAMPDDVKAQMEKSAGAKEYIKQGQRTDYLKMKEEGTLVGGPIVQAFSKAFEAIPFLRTPIRSGYNSTSGWIRHLTGSLFDSSLITKGDIEAPRGHNVEIANMRSAQETELYMANQVKAYKEFIGSGSSNLPIEALNLKAQKSGLKTFEQFMQEVMVAARKTDVSEFPPAVQRIVSETRKLLDEAKARAVEQGVNINSIDDPFQQYIPQIADRQKILRDKDGFIEKAATNMYRRYKALVADYKNLLSAADTKAWMKLQEDTGIPMPTKEQILKMDEAAEAAVATLRKDPKYVGKTNEDLLRIAKRNETKKYLTSEAEKLFPNETKGFRSNWVKQTLKVFSSEHKKGLPKMIKGADLEVLDEFRMLAKDYTNKQLELGGGLSVEMADMTKAITEGKVPRSKARNMKFNLADDPDLAYYFDNDLSSIVFNYKIGLDRITNFRKMLNENGLESAQELFTKLRDDYQQMVNAAKTEKEKLRLWAKYDEDVKWLNDSIQMNLGTFYKPSTEGVENVMSVVRAYNTTRMMGGILAVSQPDLAMSMLTYNIFKGLGRSFIPGLRQLFDKSLAKMTRADLQKLSLNIEMDADLATRAVLDPDFDGSVVGKIRKASNRVVSVFMKSAGFTHFQDMNVKGALNAASLEFIDIGKKIKVGEALSDADRVFINKAGIGEDDLKRLMSRFDKYGDVEKGYFIGNYEKWPDDELTSKYANALLKLQGETILRPSMGDLPFSFQRTGLGKVVTQFKAFPAAASNRLFMKTAQRLAMKEYKVLNGLVMLTAFGIIGDIVAAHAAGRPYDWDPVQMVMRGFLRSGFLGMQNEFLLMMIPGARHTKYAGQSFQDYAFGPSGNLLSNFYNAGYGAYYDLTEDGEMSQETRKAIKKLVPWNNMLWINSIMRKAFGIEDKQ